MAPKIEKLWLLQQDEERVSFAQLYNRYKALCFSHALGITGDEDRAGDIVQESFVAVYKQVTEKGLQFNSLRHARDYLLKVVRHMAINNTKVQARKVELEDIADSLTSLEDQEEKYIEEERLEACRRALKRLPSKYRNVLRLRFYEKMTLAEIAQHLGKPPTTIQYMEKKALGKIKKDRIVRTFFS
ncbi:MAG: sigma-70 family RNA polymerase sigma factor [Gemmatimonadota bacterium]|nr:MAG: sigma-70 family RNA polymerase sigma factor [Gemmatimonadota bacterium]